MLYGLSYFQLSSLIAGGMLILCLVNQILDASCRLFIKKQASGTLSGNEWQGVVQPVKTNDNEWQRVTKNVNDWKRMPASDKTNSNE